MAADDPKFGIKRFAGEFVDEVKTSEKVTVAERKNRIGKTKRVFPHDEKTDVSISGGGTAPLAIGAVTTHGVSGLTGGVFVVTQRDQTDTNDNFDSFSISATHYPDAELGAVATVEP